MTYSLSSSVEAMLDHAGLSQTAQDALASAATRSPYLEAMLESASFRGAMEIGEAGEGTFIDGNTIVIDPSEIPPSGTLPGTVVADDFAMGIAHELGHLLMPGGNPVVPLDATPAQAADIGAKAEGIANVTTYVVAEQMGYGTAASGYMIGDNSGDLTAYLDQAAWAEGINPKTLTYGSADAMNFTNGDSMAVGTAAIASRDMNPSGAEDLTYDEFYSTRQILRQFAASAPEAAVLDPSNIDWSSVEPASISYTQNADGTYTFELTDIPLRGGGVATLQGYVDIANSVTGYTATVDTFGDGNVENIGISTTGPAGGEEDIFKLYGPSGDLVYGTTTVIGPNGEVSISVTGEGAAVEASNSTINIAASASATVNGEGNTISLNENGVVNLLEPGNSVVSGTASVSIQEGVATVSNAGGTLQVSGDNFVATVGENSSVTFNGASNEITLGEGSAASVTGTGNEVIADGNSAVVDGAASVTNTGGQLQVTGDNLTASVEGGNVTLSGAGNEVSLSDGGSVTFSSEGNNSVTFGGKSVTVNGEASLSYSNGLLNVTSSEASISVHSDGVSIKASNSTINLDRGVGAAIEGGGNIINQPFDAHVSVSGADSPTVVRVLNQAGAVESVNTVQTFPDGLTFSEVQTFNAATGTVTSDVVTATGPDGTVFGSKALDPTLASPNASAVGEVAGFASLAEGLTAAAARGLVEVAGIAGAGLAVFQLYQIKQSADAAASIGDMETATKIIVQGVATVLASAVGGAVAAAATAVVASELLLVPSGAVLYAGFVIGNGAAGSTWATQWVQSFMEANWGLAPSVGTTADGGVVYNYSNGVQFITYPDGPVNPTDFDVQFNNLASGNGGTWQFLENTATGEQVYTTWAGGNGVSDLLSRVTYTYVDADTRQIETETPIYPDDHTYGGKTVEIQHQSLADGSILDTSLATYNPDNTLNNVAFNDNKGNTSNTYYDHGVWTNDTWTKADGSSEIGVKNPDGTVSRTVTNESETINTLYASDAPGAAILGDTFFKANGDFGSDAYNPDGSVVHFEANSKTGYSEADTFEKVNGVTVQVSKIWTDPSQNIVSGDMEWDTVTGATTTTIIDGSGTKTVTQMEKIGTGSDASYSFVSQEITYANGGQVTVTANGDGTNSTFGTTFNGDGSSTTFSNDGHGNASAATFNSAHELTSDSGTSADGRSWTNSYGFDGSSSGTMHYPDGSYEKYSSDGQGGSVVVKFDALDRPIGNEWWNADGSHGSETIDPNTGSKVGTSWAADGGHTNYSDDGQGNTHVTVYDSKNNIVNDHWTEADGSSGSIVTLKDGSVESKYVFADGTTSTTTWSANGVIRTAETNADGSGTTALYDGGTTIVTTWGPGGVGVTSNTTITQNPDGTTTVTSTDADGHTTERQGLPGEFAPPSNPVTPTDPNSTQSSDSAPPSWVAPGDGSSPWGGTPADNTPLAGSPTAPPDPGSTPWSDSQGGDGSATTTYTGPDGTQVSASDGSSGSGVSVSGSDGSSSVTTSVGSDGSVSTTYNNADGTTSTSQTTSDGSGDTYENWQNSDGASGNNSLYSDGSSYSYSTDGQGNSVTSTFDAGSGTRETDTQNADGSSTASITNGDGSHSNSSSADGTTVTDSYSSSGQLESAATQTPDGVTVTDFFGSDGGVAETDTMNSDGTGTKDYFDANGDPAGSSTVTVEDGRTTTSNYDNDGVLTSDSWTEGGGYGGSITSGTDVYTYGDDGSVVDNGTIQQPWGDGETDFQKTTEPDGSTQETGNNYDSGGNLTGSFENESSTNPDGSGEETGSTSYADGNVSSTYSDSTGADGSTDNVTRNYDDESGALTGIETQTSTADGATTDQGFDYGPDGTVIDSHYNTTSPDGSWTYSSSSSDGSTQSVSYNAGTGQETAISETPDGSTYTQQQSSDGSYDDSYQGADGSTSEVAWNATTGSRIDDNFNAETGRTEDASVTYGADGSVVYETNITGGTDPNVDYFSDFQGNTWAVSSELDSYSSDLTQNADGSSEGATSYAYTSPDGSSETYSEEDQKDASGSATATSTATNTDSEGNITTDTTVSSYDSQNVVWDTQSNSVTVDSGGDTIAWAQSEDYSTGAGTESRTSSDSAGDESDYEATDGGHEWTSTGISVDGQGPGGDSTWDVEYTNDVKTLDDETRADGSSYEYSFDISTGDSVAIADDWASGNIVSNYEYLNYGDGSFNDTTWNQDGSYSVAIYNASTGDYTDTNYDSSGSEIPPGDGGDGGGGGGDQPNP